MDGPTLDTSRGSTPLPAARSGLEILFGQLATRRERKKKKGNSNIWTRNLEEEEEEEERKKEKILSSRISPSPSFLVPRSSKCTNEVRVARCNKRLESGPSHVGTSAKPVLRSLGLIGWCWLPNCRAPPLLAPRKGELQNCLTRKP